jgi:uncharacterized 2Fe-2S/4Fe-4S cluster protein (DUF4445 family)
MREAEIPIKFEPHGRTVLVLKETKIMEAAGRAGISLNMPCGGQGSCGKCRVRVLSNACEATPVERSLLSDREIAEGYRLACQSRVCGPMTVDVPDMSVLASTFQILGGATGRAMDVSDVAVRKRYIELPPPGREDEAPDVDRIQRAVGPFGLDLKLLRDLPGRLRAWDFRGTAVLADHRLIDFEKGNTESECCALAFDIGTTTLVGVLLDLTTGHERATVSRMNPQTSYGDDVIARILFARREAGGLQELHDAIIAEVNDMIREIVEISGIEPSRIYEAAFSGNTTMQHLLEGVDPAALGEVPFAPATGHSLLLRAEELGLDIHPRGRAYVFPVIGGFVGGDTVAGLIATGLADADRPMVLVDIGTNGEIVVCHEGRLLATSTAAGPAFEGARITHGMRATAGAIEKVMFEDDLRIGVIGDVSPVGLCGSALIDTVAELLRHGILMGQGLLLGPDAVPDSVAPAIRKRIVETGDGFAFALATAEETRTGVPVLLTQKDVRELQLATAAIRAGFTILLRRVGLEVSQVDRVLIAGGFGNFIRRSNAQRIGLLPSDLERRRIHFVGNTSLAGACLAAVSQNQRQRAEELARRTQHVDLSMDPDFQTEYVAAMFFPEAVQAASQ